MATMSIQASGDEVAELPNEIKRLAALVEATPTKSRRRSWRRPIALAGTAILAVGMLAGVAGASGSTTEVNFVVLGPAKTILSNVAIAAHKFNSPVVIGGTT